jgi:hypothetical protein
MNAADKLNADLVDAHGPQAGCNWNTCGIAGDEPMCPFTRDEPKLFKGARMSPSTSSAFMNAVDFEVIGSPMLEIIRDIVKNNTDLTPDLQNVIAKYLDVQSGPTITTSKL